MGTRCVAFLGLALPLQLRGTPHPYIFLKLDADSRTIVVDGLRLTFLDDEGRCLLHVIGQPYLLVGEDNCELTLLQHAWEAALALAD